MKIIRCEKGYFYDGDKYTRCSYCGALHEQNFYNNERLKTYIPIAENWNLVSMLGRLCGNIPA